MSSSEDEEGRIAFTTAGDYDDGQWMGGEFYARGQRQGRRMTKEEALYGYEGSDDDRGGRKGRKRGRKDDPIKPVDFVGGKVESPRRGRQGAGTEDGSDAHFRTKEDDTMEVDEENRGSQKNLRAAEQKELEPRQKFDHLLQEGGISLQSIMDGKGQDFFRGALRDAENRAAETQAKEEAKKAQKQLPVRKDPRSMGWESHSKGFASKYLARFGFKGRLGKEESGIISVPEVVVRPERLGLGIMKEATQLRANREIEADLHGREVEEHSDDEEQRGRRRKKDERKLSIAEQMALDSGSWKRGRKTKPRHKKLSVQDVLSMEKDADFVHEGENKQVIKDLRGPQEKLLTRLDEINYEIEAGPLVEDEPPKLGQELLHNVNLLVDLCESGLYGLDRRIRHDERRQDELVTQLVNVERRVQEGEDKTSRLDKVSTLISRVDEKIKKTQGDVPLDAVLKVFLTIKGHFWEEYVMFELWELAPTLLTPVLNRHLTTWDPLSQTHVIDVFHDWLPVLGSGKEGDENSNPLLAKLGEAICQDMTRKLLLPKVRSALVNQWEVRNVEPAVQLVERLRPVVRADDWDGILGTVVMPKITHGKSSISDKYSLGVRQAVYLWNPREDVVPIHQWIHPWLATMGVQLAAVFPEIRRKLSAVLTEWHPSDASAHVILSPWVRVFDARSFETLLLRSIVPKLVQALRQLPIVPHNQDLQPLEWVFTWADLLSPLHFLSLLEGELFPKWLQVLHAWLQSANADLSEIADWFEGWKNLYPPQVQTDPRIAAHFDHALQAMNHAMDPTAPPLPSLPLDQVTYLAVVEDRRREAFAAAAAGLNSASTMMPPAAASAVHGMGGMGTSLSGPPTVTPMDVTFKDLVERFAEKNGVLLLPKPGKVVQGRQVYSFGGISVYMENDVLFADMGKLPGTGAGATYMPVALEVLLQHTRPR